MKTTYHFLYLMVGVLLLLSIISCEKEPNCNADFNIELALYEAEDDWIDAEVDYFFDPSDENCKDLKAAIENYLDEADKIKDCARKTGKADELNDLIEEAESDLADLPCQ